MKHLFLTTALSSIVFFGASAMADEYLPLERLEGLKALEDTFEFHAIYQAEGTELPDPEIDPSCKFDGIELISGKSAADSDAIEMIWIDSSHTDFNSHKSGHAQSNENDAVGVFVPAAIDGAETSDAQRENLFKLEFDYTSINNLKLKPNHELTIIDWENDLDIKGEQESTWTDIEWQISLDSGNNGNIHDDIADGAWPAEGGGWLYSNRHENVTNMGIWDYRSEQTGTDSNEEIAWIDFGDGTPATEHRGAIGIEDLKIFVFDHNTTQSGRFKVLDGNTYKMSLDVVCYSDE